MGHGELLARLLGGTIFGAIIGYERQLHGRPAGLRTHLLVGLASTTFMIVSTHFVYFQHYTKDDLVAVDTSRISASVVTGVGFLGGGAILRTGVNVQGLTTAAGLWLVAAIGLSAGGGMYAISASATGIGVAALTVLRGLERKEDDMVRRRITLTLDETAPPLKTIFSALNAKGAVIGPAEYDKHVDERRVHIAVHVRLPKGTSEDIIAAIEAQPGVRRVQIDLLELDAGQSN
jgi:putative Mg2+ transporter-C (MgtC) family protein